MSAKPVAVVATIAVMALGATGCGDEGPAEADLSTVQAVLRSSAEVDRVMQPLYGCLPQEVACYKRSGPRALAVVLREKRKVGPTLAATDHPCLAEVGRLFGKALNGYADAGRAAAKGNSSEFDAAISRTTRDEIAYVRKLNDCGFSEGRVAEIGAAVREVNVAMLRLGEEVVHCQSSACVNRVAREMEKQADIGVARIDEFIAEIDDDAPNCFRDALVKMRETFVAARRAAVAIQQQRFAAAEREGNRSMKHAVLARQLAADCLESQGS